MTPLRTSLRRRLRTLVVIHSTTISERYKNQLLYTSSLRRDQTEKYSRLGSSDDSTDRTAFGNTAAANNSNRAVAGDRTDGGRPSDTTAGRIAFGRRDFPVFCTAAIDARGRDGARLYRGRRLGYNVGRVNTRARSGQCVITTGRASAVGAPGRRAEYA